MAEHFRQHCPLVGNIATFLDTDLFCAQCVCPVCYRLCSHCVNQGNHLHVPADSPTIVAIADRARERANTVEESFDTAAQLHTKLLPAMLIEDICWCSGFPAGFWQVLHHRETSAEMLLAEPLATLFQEDETLRVLFGIVGTTTPPQERYMTDLARCGRVLPARNYPFRLTVRNDSVEPDLVQLRVTLWGFSDRHAYTGVSDPSNLFALLAPVRCYHADYPGVNPEPSAAQAAADDLIGAGPGRGLWERRYFGEESEGELTPPPSFWISRLGGLSFDKIPYADTMVRGSIIYTHHMPVDSKINMIIAPLTSAVQTRVLVIVGHPRVADLWRKHGIRTMMDVDFVAGEDDERFRDVLVIYDNITALQLSSSIPLNGKTIALLDVNYRSPAVAESKLADAISHAYRPAVGSFAVAGKNRAQLVKLIDAVVRVPGWRSPRAPNITPIAMTDERVAHMYDRATHIHRILGTKNGPRIITKWLRGGGDSGVPPDLDNQIDRACESSGIVTDNTKCPVCLEVVELRVTQCGHNICAGCIREWYRVNPSCPLCRGEMLPDREATHVSASMIDCLKGDWPAGEASHPEMRLRRVHAIARHLLDQHNDGCHRIVLVSQEFDVTSLIQDKVDGVFIGVPVAKDWDTFTATESVLLAISPQIAKHGLELKGVDLIVFADPLDAGGIREHAKMVAPEANPPIHVMYWDHTVEKGWAMGVARRRPIDQRPVSEILDFRMRMMIR